MKEIDVWLKICGDYVAFHEMGFVIDWYDGLEDVPGIFYNILDYPEDYDITDEEMNLINEILDIGFVSEDNMNKVKSILEYISSKYEGDGYCDYGYFKGVKVNEKIYVEI